MPISADRFEDTDDDDDPAPGTNAHGILSFLEQHPAQTFTQSELVAATGINRGSVGPTLVRLREDGRVDHRGTYWRISDHDRSLEATVGHGASVATSHEDEPMSDDEWQKHAVDPRENRE